MQESMGELEYQLSDQLFNEYTALSDSDKKAVRDRVDCYMNDDYCYINASYDCWALVLDVETFNQDQEDGESSKWAIRTAPRSIYSLNQRRTLWITKNSFSIISIITLR